jgi:integrase
MARGIPAGPEFLLDYDVIEAFCVAGLDGRACSTRGTYRSALYRLAMPVHGQPGQRATPFAGARAPLPYAPADRAELAALAAAQRDAARRAPALALVVFGIGAGLRPGELVALRGSDVSCRGYRVTVRVGGRPHGWCRSPRVTRGGRPGWLAARDMLICSGPARRTAATRTSSPSSPAPWRLIRPRPG